MMSFDFEAVLTCSCDSKCSSDNNDEDLPSDDCKGVVGDADGDASRALIEFKSLIACKNVAALGPHALKVVEWMQLGKIEKGSLLLDSKYKLLHARWFGEKKSRNSRELDTSLDDVERVSDQVYIARGTLVTMKYNRGKSVTTEHYRVLGIFSKHYNKWFVHWDSDRVLFKRE